MRLSDHFVLSEFTASATAVKYGIPNNPNAEQIQNMKTLCIKCMESIRRKLGRPIKITSGFRSVALNKKVGGKSNSHHLKGFACDFVVNGLEPNAIVNKIKQDEFIEYTQLIEEHSKGSHWVHISYVSNNLKRETLVYKNGKYAKV